MSTLQFRLGAVLLCTLCVLPLFASAHEVYVLNSTTITSGLADTNLNVLASLKQPGNTAFFVWSMLLGVLSVIIISYFIHTKLSKHLDERFEFIRPYAHLVIRVGLGISFLWGAHHNSVFGPELPLSVIPGGMLWKPVLVVIGLMLIAGFMTRLASIIALFLFILVSVKHPAVFGAFYMMNYLNYFGEIVVLLLERGTKYSLDEKLKWPSHIFHPKFPRWFEQLEALGEKYSFVIIRWCFGIALVWAAISIKMLHPKLSLDVLSLYSIDQRIAFTALFFVFMAGIVEIVLGLVLILGILYRIGLFILIFFVGYSVWFFGEEVWPHAILVALAVGLFLHGKDKWCLEDPVYKLFWGWTKRFRKSKSSLSPE